MTHSKLKSQHNRKDPKTDDICKGIDLDPEAFLFFCSVLLGPCDLSVKHIAQSGKCQAAHCCRNMVRHSAEDPDHGRNYAYVSHYYRVIIKSNHLHTSFFSFSCQAVSSVPQGTYLIWVKQISAIRIRLNLFRIPFFR